MRIIFLPCKTFGLLLGLFLILILFSVVNTADAVLDLGISIGEEGVKSFYVAVGDYYRVPQRDVIIIRERHIDDEEIPVVFFLAGRARVTPAAIIDLRVAGRSWMDITLHLGLSPEIFYVPVDTAKIGPPYGKAYGYYKNRPKKEWRHLKFSDSDVVDLVNLRFISDYYKYSPEEVIKLRGKGKNFVAISSDITKEKKGHKEKIEKIKDGKEERKEGKERHKGKGRAH